ncbi:hypothetical protein CK203_057113 [Vitis vinifera]|uniref:Reverse transcriptase RNase H-like domain-containing protein n=1 Tax=Vitis vinifera TaxID=29760 RepID=A0A438GHR3_VITVI|nr:hypothetical protein CK203_057113 [Vitis vinifera]
MESGIAPSAFPRTSRAKEVPPQPLPSIFAPSTSAHSEPVPETLTITQTAIMERMDHLQLRQDQQTLILRDIQQHLGLLPPAPPVSPVPSEPFAPADDLDPADNATSVAVPPQLHQTTSEDVFPEDERLNLWFLGVKEARNVEVYVDDMIVKSRGRADHLAALERFFKRIRKFRLRLNPKKCTFGVTFGKLLGHGCPLLLYLSVSDMTLGCMLAQLDDSGKERAIYYLSKRMLEYEMRYVTIERLYLALVWAIRRLRHYMTEYSMYLISHLDPLRYLFDRPTLADHLAPLPTIKSRPVDDDFLDEEFVAMTRLSGWCMYFDGATNHLGYGIGVLLVSPQGDHIPRFVYLTFPNYHPTTNNIVEYEACILDLETALELDITQMDVLGIPI